MKLGEFETIVAEEIDCIPDRFRTRIRNLAFTVAEEPTPDQLRENDIPEGDTLLGLFEGVTLGEQGASGWELPNRIIVFRKPCEDEATEHGIPVQRVVRETIWHEVAHYLGMDEDEVLTAEHERHKRKR